MQWQLVVHFTILSVSLVIATIFRANIRFLQRFLVPNAITAGFIGLGLTYLISTTVLHIMPDREVLGNIVYHLLAITFISIGLKKRKRYIERNSIATAFHLTLGYALQGFIGYTLTLILLFTILPDIFPAFGMLFSIGFGQSSGQAYALGKQWEAMGFVHGSTVGLAFGALGFLWSCFVGIPFLNWGIKKGYVKKVSRGMLENRGFFRKDSARPILSRSTTHPDVIASGSFHLAFIGFIYLIDYFFIKLVVFLLGRIGGQFLVQFGNILWAYHAFFATILALITGKILDLFNLHHILDDDTLTSISASSVDFLVTAAIMGIEVVVAVRYIFPIVLITAIGGVLTMFLILFLSKRIFKDYFFERVISIFGLLTGTVSTGLALLRVIDPEYRTPAASDLILGSGFSLFLGFPLLFLINIPALTQTVKVFLLTDLAILGYVLLLFLLMLFLGLLRNRK